MLIPCILMLLMSGLLVSWGIVDLRQTVRLYKDRQNLLGSMRRRTGRTMGTVVGGSAALYGERLRCPLVRFEVDGDECLATGPAIRSIRKGREKGIRKGALVLPSSEFYYTRSRSREFVAAIESMRLTQTDCNGYRIRNRWDLSYTESVLASLYPVGEKVAVSYDPEYPQSNNAVLLPDGSDDVMLSLPYLLTVAVRSVVELASGIIVYLMAAGLLLGAVIVA